MFTIFAAWGESLDFLTISNLKHEIGALCRLFMTAVQRFMPVFLLFVLIDAVIIGLHLHYGLNSWVVGNQQGGLLLTSVGIFFLWDTATLCFLAVLHQSMSLQPKKSIWYYLLRLYQWRIIRRLVLLLFFLILVDIGIYLVPQMHWLIGHTFFFLHITTLLFWLDTSSSLRNIARTFEKVLNFIFYHMPFYLLLGAAVLSLNLFFLFLFMRLGSGQVIFSLYDLGLQLEAASGAQVFKFQVCKYGYFFCNMLLMTILAIFYRAKKNRSYVKEFF